MTFIKNFLKTFPMDVRSNITELKELRDNVNNREEDFTLKLDGTEYRFIHDADIDRIQQDELGSDPYVLGCFNPEFLGDILNVSSETISRMQKSDALGAIGELIIGTNKLAELQEAYKDADGYGHHFNHWDFSEEDIGEYWVFKQGA